MIAVLAAVLLAGCGDAPPSRVTGSVTFDGVVSVTSGSATVHLDGLDASIALATMTPAAPTPTPDPSQWWTAGGVDPAAVVGAYRGKGAASYTASLTNLADPLTRTLIAQGSCCVPAWHAAKGWQGGQGAYFRMAGGAYAASDWSVIMSVHNAATASQQFGGFANDTANRWTTSVELNNTGAWQDIHNFGELGVSGVVTSGVMAIAGKAYYKDGALVGAIPGGAGTALYDWYWLTSNWAGSPHGGAFVTEVRGMAIYSATLTAAQVGAVTTAMGGL